MEDLYKVVIVDDESLITKGLSEKIAWESLGCRIAGIGNHGVEGLRLLEEHCPDILITDIIMPGKTGLELAAYISKNRIRTKIILLTAYEEFEYAREAISYGVSDYIVKPIDKEEIIKAVKNIVQRLNFQHKLIFEQEQKDKIVLKMKPILTQAVLFDNTIYGISRDELREVYSDIYDPSFASGAVAVMRLSALSYETSHSSLENLAKFSIFSFSAAFLERSGSKAIIKQTDDLFVVIFALKRKEQLESAKEILHSLVRHIYQEKSIVCHASISSVYHDISLMHLCYQEARQLLKRSYFSEGPSVFLETQIHAAASKPKVSLNELFEKISEGDIEKAEIIFNNIAYKLEAGKNTDASVEVFKEAADGLNKVLKDYGDFITESVSHEQFNLNGNFMRHKNLIFEKIRDICIYIKAKQRITDNVILQIERNYADSSFNLNSVAEMLRLNPSYLSRLFKKDKGVNFSNYLTDYRIEQAKKLLLTTDFKNSRIAERTGFSDEHYFCKVFKQKCLLTPKQYKQSKIYTKKSQ